MVVARLERTPADAKARTPAAKQIIADGGISYLLPCFQKYATCLPPYKLSLDLFILTSI
ncbi:hypothetical protein [Psychrobacter sp. GW208-MNA-CIBAN-0184]|jgi:hypothetical protein|uniref:hypothetical protein n=1 Tax=Psychrobacter sp. GW208-MNA-CIBAN-0184 TaxID=3140451 RepID=UPI000405B8B2